MEKVVYSNLHSADMHFCYDLADGNSTYYARRLYSEHYPNRQLAYHSMFARIHQRLADKGSKILGVRGRSELILEEAVLNFVKNQPESSTRNISKEPNTSKAFKLKKK